MNLEEDVLYLFSHRRDDDDLLRELGKGGRPMLEAALALQGDQRIKGRIDQLAPRLRTKLAEMNAQENDFAARERFLERRWSKIRDGINFLISLFALAIAIISLRRH